MREKLSYISASGGTETIVHDKCGTPECCGKCAPKQLELNLSKDTKTKPLSFDGGSKKEWPSLKKKLGI